MNPKKYSKTRNKLSACLANFKICFVLIALFFGSSLIAQTPELVFDEALAPTYLTEYNSKLFFNAVNGPTGSEWLWSTDGTTVNIREGNVTLDNIGSSPRYLTVLNNQLIFSSILKEGASTWYRELFKFDGTGRSLIKNIYPGGESLPKGFTEFNGKLYFYANDGTNGLEPWVTDGTESGTQLLKDINEAAAGAPRYFTEFDGKLYFSAIDFTHGNELWATDGTPEGTQLVADINKNEYRGSPNSSNPSHLNAYDGKLYFGAADGNSTTTGLQELWVTDGTESGTELLKDIDPGINDAETENFIQYQENLYFFADDGTHGYELWVTDGTTSGTRLLKDIFPDLQSGMPTFFIEYNGKLYFSASDGTHGYELWTSDGTTEGTQQLKDIYPGFDGSYPSYFTEYDGKLYFKAKDIANNGGYQLWVTDGTTAGTISIVPAIAGLSDALYETEELVVADGTLYYAADYDGNGRKLWKLTTNNLSVEDQVKNKLTAYPNPVQNFLHLETKTNNINKIDLFSITGKRLKSWKGQTDINLAQYDPGSYFLKIITSDGQIETKQILKN